MKYLQTKISNLPSSSYKQPFFIFFLDLEGNGSKQASRYK